MNRKQIIKSALSLLYDALMKDSPYLEYDYFDMRDDIDFDISKHNLFLNFNYGYGYRSMRDMQKQINENIQNGKIEKINKSMHLTTFDAFDGSCKLTYQSHVIFWDTPEKMVEEFVDAVGIDFYDQIIALMILKSYNHTKLLRKGETKQCLTK